MSPDEIFPIPLFSKLTIKLETMTAMKTFMLWCAKELVWLIVAFSLLGL